jgi:hypothetical protein
VFIARTERFEQKKVMKTLFRFVGRSASGRPVFAGACVASTFPLSVLSHRPILRPARTILSFDILCNFLFLSSVLQVQGHEKERGADIYIRSYWNTVTDASSRGLVFASVCGIGQHACVFRQYNLVCSYYYWEQCFLLDPPRGCKARLSSRCTRS